MRQVVPKGSSITLFYVWMGAVSAANWKNVCVCGPPTAKVSNQCTECCTIFLGNTYTALNFNAHSFTLVPMWWSWWFRDDLIQMISAAQDDCWKDPLDTSLVQTWRRHYGAVSGVCEYV